MVVSEEHQRTRITYHREGTAIAMTQFFSMWQCCSVIVLTIVQALLQENYAVLSDVGPSCGGHLHL